MAELLSRTLFCMYACQHVGWEVQVHEQRGGDSVRGEESEEENFMHVHVPNYR